MRKNPITFDKLEDIISIHVEEYRNFLFVCDYVLAGFICDFLRDEYAIEDEDSSLSSEIEEYYITYYEDKLCCECARGNSGRYKMSEMVDVDYFIFTDMTEKEVDKKLLDDCGAWSWCEIVDDEDYEDCCDCDACREAAELTDGQEEELRIIEQSLTEVLQANGCPDCTFEILLDLVYTFKEIGRADTRDLMRDVLDDMD